MAASLVHHEIKVQITRRLEGQGIKDAKYIGRKYIRDIEEKTNRKILTEQKQYILEAMRQKHFGNLQSSLKKANNNEYDKLRNTMIKDWERHTGQSWPKYTAKNAHKPSKIGQNYDLHHIIPKQNGGPNVWWNSHPAASPSEHQGGIHATGSLLRQLQDLIK